MFDYKDGDVFACVSDLGWLSGHTSVVYGPLCNGATTVLFEGTATYPNEGKKDSSSQHKFSNACCICMYSTSY